MNPPAPSHSCLTWQVPALAKALIGWLEAIKSKKRDKRRDADTRPDILGWLSDRLLQDQGRQP
jgi:hypothetical protein